MSENTFFKLRFYITALISVSIWSLLIWNYYHEGIPSHHFLAREDMPSFSNAWGAILIPLLTWFLLYRINNRLFKQNEKFVATTTLNAIYVGFLGALLFGAALSIIFTLKVSGIPAVMLQSLFVLALFVPIYRSEFLLGFVLGMTYTFGAVLPTIIGSVLVVISSVLYLLVRPLALKVLGFLSPKQTND